MGPTTCTRALLALAVIGLCLPAWAQTGLYDRGAPRVYQGGSLAKVDLPVGGIGTGHVGINGSALRTSWFLTGEMVNDQGYWLRSTFFALRVKAGASTVLRALQTSASEGVFAPMSSLTLRAQYPYAWYDFIDAGLPVRVAMEVYNPLIPGDVKNSGIPCAIYTVTVENTGSAPAEVDFIAAQRNAIGTGIGDGFGNNVNATRRENGSTFLHLRSNNDHSGRYHGDLVLMAYRASASVCANWSQAGDLAADLQDGSLGGPDSAGPTPNGSTINGALAVVDTLAPGETRSVTFVLCWHFPNRVAQWGTAGTSNTALATGPYYTNWWSSALDVARYLDANLAAIADTTRLFQEQLYASDLPYWFLDGLSSQTAILRSPTCFWNKDGYLGLYEGWRGAHPAVDGNCTHVIAYGQQYAFLFPEIARRVREANFLRQASDGHVMMRVDMDVSPTDGSCAEVLGVYREYLMSSDRTWLDGIWPKAKRLMDFAIGKWDGDHDGVLSGLQPETFDVSLYGATTWMGSYYLAALSAAGRMAKLENDTASAGLYARVCAAGARNQDSLLYNGRYYISIPAESYSYVNGCFTDQLIGQWWANLLGLGWLYPADHVRAAMQSVFTTNYHQTFQGYDWGDQRVFAGTSDGGVVNCTGCPSSMGYAREVWTGIEYAAAALMVQAGLVDQGFTAYKRVRERFNGENRPEAWGCGNPFNDVEYGSYYFRAQSSWSMLNAVQGLSYNGPGKTLGFAPRYSPSDHRSFFCLGQAWGTFRQKTDGSGQTNIVQIQRGGINVGTISFAVAPSLAAQPYTVTVNGSPASATASYLDSTFTLALASPVTVSAGQEIRFAIGNATSAAGTARQSMERTATLHAVCASSGRVVAISFRLPSAGRQQAAVRVSVCDAAGREVAVPLNRGLPPGEHTVPWNAAGVPAGMYLVRLQAGEATRFERVLLFW